jgi:Fe-S-cluster containining protein
MPPRHERLRYPEHEARHPWLAGLLNAYHISDAAVRADLQGETARRGAPPACRAGCHVCCVGQVVPVSDFEVLGLWWYCAELMPEDARSRVRVNLLVQEIIPACPFLLDGVCSVYPLRPFVCRQHFVYGEPCKPGENLRRHRPRDVFAAGQNAARDLAWEILPLYGTGPEDIDRRFENGYVGRKVRDLHSLPLANIVEHMDAAARRRKGENA